MNKRGIEITLDLSKSETSRWIGSMGLPAERVTGLLVKDISVSAAFINFVAFEFQNAKVSLTLERDGILKGAISSPQGPRAVVLKRTGEARVRLINVYPAVSKDLEGDWEGVIGAAQDAFSIVIHFRNLPDRTVSATVDVPDSGDFGSPLGSVKQTGRKVEFRFWAAQANFRGSLNQSGTEITGQLERTEGLTPLKLLKKR